MRSGAVSFQLLLASTFSSGFVGGPAVLQVGQMLLLFCQQLAQLLDLSVCLQQLFGALTGHGLGLFLEHGQRPQQGLAGLLMQVAAQGIVAIFHRKPQPGGEAYGTFHCQVGVDVHKQHGALLQGVAVDDVVAEPLV